MITRKLNILCRYLRNPLLLLIYLCASAFIGHAQESVSTLKKIIPDEEARALFLEYQSFYNDKEYIQDGQVNYSILSRLFFKSLEIKNDFASGRPDKISTTDYLRFLATHYPLGLDVKFKNVRVLKEKEQNQAMLIVLEYRKEIFGHFDNEGLVSGNYQERLTLSRGGEGDWKIADIDLIVPPQFSVDLVGSFYFPGFSMSRENNDLEMAGLQHEDKFSYAHGAALEFNINYHFSVATGIQFSVYNTGISANTIVQDPILLIDNSGNSYLYKAEGSKITDEVNLNYYTIPLGLKYYFLPTTKVSPFIGFTAEYHISESAQSSMTGVANQQEFSRSMDISVEQYFFSVSFHGGARLQLFKDKLYAMVNVFYSPALSDVVESEGYVWSPEPQKYNSILFAYEKLKLNAFGINIGLKIKLK